MTTKLETTNQKHSLKKQKSKPKTNWPYLIKKAKKKIKPKPIGPSSTVCTADVSVH